MDSRAVLRLRCLARPNRGQKNSPSRWRFRPPNLLAFRFRVPPPGPASTYSRSVLGAKGTIGAAALLCKTVHKEEAAICINFQCPYLLALRARCSGGADHAFAEPVALSSTVPTGFPLPRTTSRPGFDLLALRARRSKNLLRRTPGLQPRCGPKRALFAPSRSRGFPVGRRGARDS